MDTSDCTLEGPYGYYDSDYNWIPDPCYPYAYDVDLYAACYAFGGGAFLPKMNPFRSPGVRQFVWYSTGAGFRVRTENPVANTVVPPASMYYNETTNDLIFGQIFVGDNQIQPLLYGATDWCFETFGASSPFMTDTIDIFASNSTYTKQYRASLATVGLNRPSACP